MPSSVILLLSKGRKGKSMLSLTKSIFLVNEGNGTSWGQQLQISVGKTHLVHYIQSF
jgi:hypothetical protein